MRRPKSKIARIYVKHGGAQWRDPEFGGEKLSSECSFLLGGLFGSTHCVLIKQKVVGRGLKQEGGGISSRSATKRANGVKKTI